MTKKPTTSATFHREASGYLASGAADGRISNFFFIFFGGGFGLKTNGHWYIKQQHCYLLRSKVFTGVLAFRTFYWSITNRNVYVLHCILPFIQKYNWFVIYHYSTHMNYVSACIAKEKACDNNNIDKIVNNMGNGINIFWCHLEWKCFLVKFWIKVESFPRNTYFLYISIQNLIKYHRRNAFTSIYKIGTFHCTKKKESSTILKGCL